MKTYLLLISLIIGSYVNAQIPAWWPTHPLDTRIGDKPIIQPDTIVNKSTNYRLGEVFYMWEITEIHSYGDNGYIDSTKVCYMDTTENNIPYISTYSNISTYSKENNKLISIKTYRSDDFSSLSSQTLYEYDSVGRYAKTNHITYNENQHITLNSITLHDYSNVIYTDSGYIFNGVTYSFDENNRLIKEVSGRDTAYIYITTYNYHNDNHGYDIERETNSWCFVGDRKVEHRFDENGLLLKSTGYGFSPDPDNLAEYSYSFRSKDPTNNSFVSVPANIYGVTGGLMISSNQPEQVFIYSLSGQLIKKAYVQGSNQQIPLAKGIYIVKSNSKTTKVIVK